MTRTVVLSASQSTFTDSTRPSKVVASGSTIYLSGSTARKMHGFVTFPIPDWLYGATVISATIETDATQPITTAMQRHAKPSGLYKALTWNNEPGLLAGSAALSQTKPTLYHWVWNATADFQAIALGGEFYGYRMTSTTTLVNAYFAGASYASVAYRPKLTLVVAEVTPTPLRVSPAGVISVAAPVVTWVGPSVVDSVRVQVDDADGDFTSLLWDSGVVASTLTQLDTAAAGWSGLAAGASVDLRVLQHTPDYGWSDPSLPVRLTRTAFGTLTVTSPGATSSDPTPPHLWTYGDGPGGTVPDQIAWQILTYADATNKLLADSGKRAGADTSYTPATGPSVNGTVVRDVWRFWDAVQNRASSPGDPGYLETTRTWTLTASGSVTPVTGLTATAGTGVPKVTLQWTRGTAADEYIVYRDDGTGPVIVDRFPASENLVGANWVWVDQTMPPNRNLTYGVASVQGGAAGAPVNAASVKVPMVGLWVVGLADPSLDGSTARDLTVCVADSGVADSLAYADATETWAPPGANRPITRTTGLRGIEGTVSGFLRNLPQFGLTVLQMRADLDVIRSRPDRVYRVLFGDMSIPATINSVSAVQTGEAWAKSGDVAVSFDVRQQGEVPSTLDWG